MTTQIIRTTGVFSSICLLIVVGPLSIAMPASEAAAQTLPEVAADAGTGETPVARAEPAPKEWDITVGAGAVVRPTYEGSDRTVVTPVPFASVTWRDTISLGIGGLSAYWHNDKLRVGAGLTYAGGRDDKKGGIFGGGDDRLRGLGDVDGALGVRAFASYQLGPIEISGSATKRTASGNDGLTADLGLATRVRPTEHIILRPYVSATWADRSYTETYFGVTPEQSANSRFTAFDASSGFKDAGVGVSGTYLLDRHWSLTAVADVKRLIGDAAKSPLTFSKTQTFFLLTAGYRF